MNQQNNQEYSAQQPNSEQPVQPNPILGKTYSFISMRGTNKTSLGAGRVISTVKAAEDRLLIDISPDKFNKAPVIFYEDITAVSISTNIPLYYWFLIVISVIAGLASSGIGFIFTALLIFVGMQRKITIYQRNGVSIDMYTGSKAAANNFKDDIKKVAKIQ